MKVFIDDKEYVEKEELFNEVNRLLSQDKVYDCNTQEEKDAIDYALTRMQNVLF